MDGWNTSFFLGWPIFRSYVCFRERKDLQISKGFLATPRTTLLQKLRNFPLDWRADEVNTRRLDALGKEAHGVGFFLRGKPHSGAKRYKLNIEFICVFFSMFRKLGVKIFRDALDWLSLVVSFITMESLWQLGVFHLACGSHDMS